MCDSILEHVKIKKNTTYNGNSIGKQAMITIAENENKEFFIFYMLLALDCVWVFFASNT